MPTTRKPPKPKPRTGRKAPAPKRPRPSTPPPADPAISAAPVGRPPIVLTEDQVKQVEVMAGLGLTREEIAAVLGVSLKTLERIKREDEDVADAFDRGRATVTRDVLQGLTTRAKSGDPVAVKLYLTVMRRPGFTEAGEGEGGRGSGVQINLLGGPTGLEVNVAPGATVQLAEPASSRRSRAPGSPRPAPSRVQPPRSSRSSPTPRTRRDVRALPQLPRREDRHAPRDHRAADAVRPPRDRALRRLPRQRRAPRAPPVRAPGAPHPRALTGPRHHRPCGRTGVHHPSRSHA